MVLLRPSDELRRTVLMESIAYCGCDHDNDNEDDDMILRLNISQVKAFSRTVLFGVIERHELHCFTHTWTLEP